MQPNPSHEAPDLVLISLVLLWAALEAALVVLIGLGAVVAAATGRGPSGPLLPAAPAAPAMPVVITPALQALAEEALGTVHRLQAITTLFSAVAEVEAGS